MTETAPRKTGHAVARVAFTANRAMVKQALDEGWSARAIYELNREKLAGISYRHFLRYVNEMRPPPPAASRAVSAPSSPPPTTNQGTPDARHEPSQPIEPTFRGKLPSFGGHDPSPLTEEKRLEIYGPSKPKSE